MPEQSGIKVYKGMGVIKEVDLKQHQIIMAHEPIEAFKWPAMTMPFNVNKSVDLQDVEAKQSMWSKTEHHGFTRG